MQNRVPFYPRALSTLGGYSTRVGNANAGWSATPLPLIACPVPDTGVSASNRVGREADVAGRTPMSDAAGTHHVR